jgi:hypothetical protein
MDFENFPIDLKFLIWRIVNMLLRGKWMEIAKFMLITAQNALKATGQLPGTAKAAGIDSWEFSKGI